MTQNQYEYSSYEIDKVNKVIFTSDLMMVTQISDEIDNIFYFIHCITI